MSTKKLPGTKKLRKRARLFKKQKGLCFYCREPMRLMEGSSHTSLIGNPNDMCTLDHFYPQKLGAKKCTKNAVAACAYCNSSKGHDLPTPREIQRLYRDLRQGTDR